ncbi:MAG TPA: hypothetical protein VME20_10525 [Acidimicrobiales bacterium]|nr:hypothetical protein [Acidimicrobiales bacterium]
MGDTRDELALISRRLDTLAHLRLSGLLSPTSESLYKALCETEERLIQRVAAAERRAGAKLGESAAAATTGQLTA